MHHIHISATVPKRQRHPHPAFFVITIIPSSIAAAAAAATTTTRRHCVA